MNLTTPPDSFKRRSKREKNRRKKFIAVQETSELDIYSLASQGGSTPALHNMSERRASTSSRKRQRSLNHCVLVTILALCLSASTTSAFSTLSSSSSLTSRALVRLDQVRIRVDYVEDDFQQEDKGWLSWMKRGRKYGTSEIKMREAEELGGVPRSDRYSSR